jgi:phage N-6-adenine-methyltransferase
MILRIDLNLKALIPPLSEDEKALLEQSILDTGCRDPLVVWDGLLIDGHNRYDICTRHGLPFNTTDIHFDGIEQARVWMRKNQMGRRNLTTAWRIELELANKEDLAAIGRKTQGKRTDLLSQNDKKSLEHKHNTQGEIAKAAGTSTGMVGMAEQIRKKSPELWEQAKRDEVTVSAAYKQLNQAHVANNSGNNEWYTPKNILEAARHVLGGFDLDPASSETANNTVKALKYFTELDDGLIQEWPDGVRIWMNPPYAQPLIGQFAVKFSQAINQGSTGIVLVNNATETTWFQLIASVCAAICFPKSRIKFIDMNGNPSGSPLQGQAIIYCGDNIDLFVEHFGNFGLVVKNANI